MTSLMINLRRSPRTLLERDGHPGPGPGHLALVMARAGVGKTAFLVGIGIDALLSGQKVLHISLERTVEKIRDWYDDLLHRRCCAARRSSSTGPPIQLEIEQPPAHPHLTSAARFRSSACARPSSCCATPWTFVPQRHHPRPDGDRRHRTRDPRGRQAARDRRRGIGAELWMACRLTETARRQPGHCAAMIAEHLVDTAFRLDPQDKKVRLHVVKDGQQMLARDLNVLLDPQDAATGDWDRREAVRPASFLMRPSRPNEERCCFCGAGVPPAPGVGASNRSSGVLSMVISGWNWQEDQLFSV